MKNEEEQFLESILKKLSSLNEKILKNKNLPSGHIVESNVKVTREVKNEIADMLKIIEDRKTEINRWRLGYL